MAAIEPHSVDADLVAHERTYHGFNVLLRWVMLSLAATISALTVWFATPGGFLGALVVGVVVWVVGYFGMVRREEKQPLDPWTEGR